MGEISVKTGNNARNGGKNSLNRLIRLFAGKKSAQIREILISESAWEEMTCLFAPSLTQQTEPGNYPPGMRLYISSALFTRQR
ncbi:hypothetical protein ACYKEA_005450 [Pluralibacter gergoviae]